MSRPQTAYFSPEEYLAFERGTDARHEYLAGQVYAMAGESLEHSRICVNLAGELRARLRGGPCEALSPNMKIVTAPPGLFAYPDATVVCGEPRFHDERRDVLLNPTAIFEVLSPSTEAYDRGEKFLLYRMRIATLQDYVLVSQGKPFVEHFSRQPDGSWLYSPASGLTESLHLASVDCRLPAGEIYDRIAFVEVADSRESYLRINLNRRSVSAARSPTTLVKDRASRQRAEASDSNAPKYGVGG